VSIKQENYLEGVHILMQQENYCILCRLIKGFQLKISLIALLLFSSNDIQFGIAALLGKHCFDVKTIASVKSYITKNIN
jgi:hypothetical protein